MPRRSGLFAFLIALTVLAAPATAWADDASPADRTAMQALVQGQIDAFRHDDAATAYSFAAPGIHAMFPTAEMFLGMVKNAYPQVYRPQSVVMGDIATGPTGGFVEKVFLTTPDGQSWIALYSFEREPDGSWKISGCQILKDTAPSI